MDRREFNGLTFWSLAGVCASGAAVAQVATQSAPTEQANRNEPKTQEQSKQCAEACSACAHECNICATHCAAALSDGKKEHMATLMSCRDCADVCTTAASIVSRGGPFSALVCECCAEACGRCAQECEKYPDSDAMSRCAKACRNCEKACRQMAKSGKV